MADNLEQMKISVENNIKMFTLAERESKRLLARNRHSELEKCKDSIEMRMTISTLSKNWSIKCKRLWPRKMKKQVLLIRIQKS